MHEGEPINYRVEGGEKGNEQLESFMRELPNIDGFIDFSQLQRIGQGGTHDVYIFPQNPAFVIKLNRAVRGVLKDAFSVDPIDREAIDQHIEGENSRNEQLYKHFGQEHCLYEKVMLQKVSVEQDGVMQNTEGVISIQKASDVFKDPNQKDFCTGYTEQDPSMKQNKEVYDKMNKALLGNYEFDENDFLKCNENLRTFFELRTKTKNLRIVYENFY